MRRGYRTIHAIPSHINQHTTLQQLCDPLRVGENFPLISATLTEHA